MNENNAVKRIHPAKIQNVLNKLRQLTGDPGSGLNESDLLATGAVPLGPPSSPEVYSDATSPVIQTANRPPNSHALSSDENKRNLTIVVAPWKILEESAITSGWGEKWKNVFGVLAQDEEAISRYSRLKKSLLSDNPQTIEKTINVVCDLDEFERNKWLNWLSQSEDESLKKILNEVLQQKRILLPENRKQVQPPKPVLTSEYDIAKNAGLSNEDIEQLFHREKARQDLGKAGIIEFSQPSPFERFIDDSLKEITIKDPEQWNNWIFRLTRLIDVVRYRGKLFMIDAPRAIEGIVSAVESIKSGSLTSTWDLLSRFEIPKSQELIGTILALMEKHDNLDHPLAIILLDMLDKEHPFYKTQLKRIEELERLCTGSVQEVSLRLADLIDLSRKIITIYPKGADEKIGFDWEVYPQILGIPLPKGVILELDGVYGVPELRLERDNEVLIYYPDWRRRMLELGLWQSATKSKQISIHFHIQKPKTGDEEKKFYALLKAFFGEDYLDMHPNSQIPTFEVRLSLQDYPGYRQNQKPFRDGHDCFPLIDFLIALKHANIDLDLSWISNQYSKNLTKDLTTDEKFLSIAATTTDEKTRAAALIALHRNLGGRIVGRDGKYLVEKLKGISSSKISAEESLMISEWTGGNVDDYIKFIPQTKFLEPDKRYPFLLTMLEQTGYSIDAIREVIPQTEFLELDKRYTFLEIILEETGYDDKILRKAIPQTQYLEGTDKLRFLQLLKDEKIRLDPNTSYLLS
jgi:hypothetical protein